jgi:hypothetical protein
MLSKITDRHMKTGCSCFAPDDERPAQFVKEVREACEKEGTPFIATESDASPEDIGQIQTPVEAFLERIRARG